jgi:hypothetical protein
VERDAEEAALGGAVDGEVEGGAPHRAAHDVLHLARSLLEHEHLVRAEEGEADRLLEAARRGADGEVRVDDGRRRLSLGDEGEAGHDAERERPPQLSSECVHDCTSGLGYGSEGLVWLYDRRPERGFPACYETVTNA